MRARFNAFTQRPASILLLLFAFCLLVAALPIPLVPYLDFQVLYHADLGILQGIPLYDTAGQAGMIARLAGVSPERVFVLPFPYPPWYALATIFLALLPIQVAARLWLGLNLSMLAASVWLLTDGWKPRLRLAVLLPAILFIPSLGSLVVGQFIFPVLLGAALMTFSLRRGNVPLTALAAALLTFKPHLGGPLAAAVLLHLFLRRDDFALRARTAILLTAVFLFALGFLADPAWPANYLRALLAFREIPGVSSCGLCASLPVTLVALLSGQSNIGPALPLGAALFVLLLAALFFLRRNIFREPGPLVSALTLVTLLADPYLLNYDFALLLVPLILLTASAPRANWFWLALAYLLPLLFIGLLGRAGSQYISLAALLLLILQTTRGESVK